MWSSPKISILDAEDAWFAAANLGLEYVVARRIDALIRAEISIVITSYSIHYTKLYENPNRVFTKAQLYGFIWNDEYYGDENVINVHIRRLREKIEDQPSEPRYIKTLWGIGYKWEGQWHGDRA